MKLSLAIFIFMTFSINSKVEGMYRTPQDSKELQFQDMLMLFLLPQIDKAVTDYYSYLHIGIGKDRITLQIGSSSIPSTAKLLKYERG